jgi:hypothetical protein
MALAGAALAATLGTLAAAQPVAAQTAPQPQEHGAPRLAPATESL